MRRYKFSYREIYQNKSAYFGNRRKFESTLTLMTNDKFRAILATKLSLLLNYNINLFFFPFTM